MDCWFEHGAYAALKFGALVGADRIIAFNPENKLGMKFSKSIENSNLISDEHNNFDLCSLKYNENSEIIIVSNNGNFVDYYSANKFKHAIPNSKVYVLNNFKNNILEELNQTKMLMTY
ncbi:hypothetical protein [Citrobacter werkmanii]|uniref:hypothetical protein n=1 Tax=Citrobacter werkmanii TaxID=67827 RepID=UPI001EF2685E|nr:hypothetical protein [Citrobacter werkmanii]